MADVSIDVAQFCRRLKRLYECWTTQQDGVWSGANVLAVAVGAPSEDLRYLKSNSLHLWLFGYELPETVMLFVPGKVLVLTSQKKATLLQPAVDAASKGDAGAVALEVLVKSKADDGAGLCSQLLDAARAASPSPVMGQLAKDKHTGKLMDVWTQAVTDSGLEQVDISGGVADLLACKDANEVLNVKKAALLAAKAMQNWVVPKVEDVVDSGKKMKHSKLSEMCEEAITDPQKVQVKLKADNCDIAYPPSFQSGGTYDLRVSAPSNDSALHDDGVIVVSLGTRYSSYCANISRSYIINPSKDQTQQYNALLAAQEAAIAALKPGAPLTAAGEAAVAALKSSGQEALIPLLSRNVGFGMGLEFREGSHVLPLPGSGKAAAAGDAAAPRVRPGMVFNVCLGASGLANPDATDPKARNYALQIADTVIVVEGGKPNEVATASAPKNYEKVTYTIQDEEEAGGPDGRLEDVTNGGPGAARGGAGAPGLKKALRSDDPTFKSAEQLRKEKQEELLKKKNEETLQRLTAQAGGAGGAGGPGGAVGRKVSETHAYRSVTEMPLARDLRIQVDNKAEAVLLPIYGVLVPFHITTIRNVTTTNDAGGDAALVRVTFNLGPSYEPNQRFPNAVFLKELSFRSSDVKHANKVALDIKLLRSSIAQRDKERAERATLVAQEKLVRGKKIFKLPDLWMRPAFPGKGRKVPGSLEAHANGFRYQTPKGEILDVMYRNIKHALFQPAENEMITILHMHLHNPIMVGNKKTKDVQFYTEVMDVVQTLDGGGRRNMYDPDELEDEQRERERRNKINGEFQQFVKRVQEMWGKDCPDLGLEWDIPFRELGFSGVPHRATVFLMPSVNCLVELTEMPFTVITLSDIEIVNLERVGFNLKNFDMAIVFKDFTREVLRVDAIPSKSLEGIKGWLTDMGIKYYESKLNLQWKPILKNILADPVGFVEQGGWDFLDMEKSDDEEEEGEASEEYAPSDSGGEEDDDSDDSDEDSEDASLEEEEDDDEVGDEDESEGKDWDELEEEARNADKARTYSDESDDERRGGAKKRKAGAPGPGGGAGPGAAGAAAKRRRP
ncbi:hypothetical protein HYH03_018170 [Edaphochlamys debaryana]|uniref:FACT complex subunit n=1 Tax=Edaphochlamys debaryana TaxID=47281 RepID=A0A835XKY2_9CHLO|nr:hypothetical protein HYH03_018170 [Edaphochlamys debaryana]|eukprot:KAG2482945.1 hypothetical protein HYH03_018170 [Edaphochlamys debaryana]